MAWGALIAGLGAGPAHAGTVDVTRFKAPITPTGLFTVSDPKALKPLEFNAGVMFHYAKRPIVWRFSDGTFQSVVDDQAVVDIFASMGLVRFIDVGVALPVFLSQQGPPGAVPELGDLSGGGVGDLRLLPRLQISDERSLGIGASFISEFTFGTASGDRRFQGEPGGIAWKPTFVASVLLGRARVIGSLNMKIRNNSRVLEGNFKMGDEVGFAGGVELAVGPGRTPAWLIAEATGATHFSNFFGEGHTAVELIGGTRVLIADGLMLTAGFGGGIARGIGSPAWRALLGVAYVPRAPDKDGDGIPDKYDKCPHIQEDLDDFEDDDGCPDLDNDGDEIPDTEDDCPNKAEDFNDFEDSDGCPDEADMDSDNDGKPNKVDKCPLQAEDYDDHEDDDGCPDPDNDVDGIPDDQDLCPDEKETINGIEDYDGCPDEGEGLTSMGETKIEIKETILFESGKAVLKERSKPLLDQVALQILAHPEIQKVRIEGHTDDRGDAEDNLYLSQDRADAVRRYLVKRGVLAEKLEALGFGEAKPIATNNTKTGRAKNRRVEFVIISGE